MLQTQMSQHLASSTLRSHLYSGPVGCRTCAGLLAGPKISVDLWQKGWACLQAAHISTYTELGPCQGMGLMTGGQGGVAILGLRPHQPMPNRQMVQGWKHFRTQGHLISQGGFPGAMSLLGQN